MSLRMPATAAIAVLLASLSLSSVLQGAGWFGAGLGAVIVVGASGLAARLPGPRPGAIATAAVLVAVVPLLLWPSRTALVVGLVIVALTAASATGARPLRALAVLVLYVAPVFIYLNLWFAHGSSYAYLIPSHASVDQLGSMVQQAFRQFQFSPPVQDTRAVSLVGAAGIALVAVLVDLLAVRMRRPATAGLPLLVLFSVPIASTLKNFGPQQALTFAAGMSGFLMLLSTASRERLQMWGQLVTFRYIQSADETETGPDTRELAASGRRIGLAAICLAVIVPIVLPTLQPQQLFGTGSGTPHSGPGSGGTLDPMLQVQHELQEKNPRTVFTYTTTAPDPASQYFQVYVLTYRPKLDTWVPQFSGSRTALVGTGDESLPYSPTGQLATTPAQNVSTTVTMAQGQGTPLYLPVPYAPVKLKLPGRTATPGWAELAGTLMLYNNELPQFGPLPYTVTSTEANPKPTDITAATATMPNYIANQYGFYNGPDRDQLLTIVNQHSGRAQSSLERALLLQNWLLTGNFRYSVNPRLPSTHWLRTFLTTRKRGYCQQFAWAFAVLARLAGIPSRIAVGYTAGTRDPDGKWRVTTADAHAWPELYFPGEGWLRFEPTPHGTTGQGTATVPTYATGNPAGGPGSLTPTGQPSAGAPGGRQPANAAGQQKPSIGLPGGFGGSPAAAAVSWIAVGLPIIALLLLLSPALARRLTRRRRWLAASGDAATAVAAWRELSDDLTDYGLARGPGETPRALARRLTREASLDQPSAEALRRIVAAAERATYARLAQPGAGLTADVTRVRRAVAGTVSVRKRIRAWLLPASTLAMVQDGLQRAGDSLSWLDTSWPALRRQAPSPARRRQAPRPALRRQAP